MALTLRRVRTPDDPEAPGGREERKYPLPAARAEMLTAWLDARLPRDSQYPEGVVTSCYYDTPQLDSYQESRRRRVRQAEAAIALVWRSGRPLCRRLDRAEVARRRPFDQAAIPLPLNRRTQSTRPDHPRARRACQPPPRPDRVRSAAARTDTPAHGADSIPKNPAGSPPMVPSAHPWTRACIPRIREGRQSGCRS